MKVNIKILAVIITIGLAMTMYFFFNLETTQKSFYESTVENIRNESYRGVVTKKYYDKHNRGREKVVLDSGRIEMDFVYEKSTLYEYIQLGDTLEKKKDSLKIRITRNTHDTIIPLKFENIK